MTNGFTLTLIDEAMIGNPDAALATLQTLASAPPLTVNSTGETTGSAAPPNAPQLQTSASAGSGTLGSVSDLNVGTDIFSQIQPGGRGQSRDPITAVRPIAPAQQARPEQTADDALGGPDSNLFRARRISIASVLIPGIDRGASSSGNRALWYAELQSRLVFSAAGPLP